MRTTYSFGASVRGPLHQQEGRPNEDTWLRSEGSYGSLVVVCDGMGSKPEARLGSKSACLAVREAVIRWAKSDDVPFSYLAHLVEIYWRLRIHPIEPRNAATTCLMALACTDGSWVVGGVGDGLVVAKTGRSLKQVVGQRGNGFSNETLGLGASSGAKSWTLVRLPPTPEDRAVILATDGVSDDLKPETLEGFCGWLLDSFHPLTPTQRWHQLTKELRAWPTPRHQDDKTLAVLRRTSEVEERHT